ncbi:hypothetical protein [Streptomyces sp. NPDC005209]|uniref:hypothetical protein n=1 Tax=Streptomyces sp. NPDC005209 TaxID=3156715 RepID=UPI0033B83901
MLLTLLLAEYLPDRLDARALDRVRAVEGVGACRSMQRLAALRTSLVQAAADSDRSELRRSAAIGQDLLWDAAGLLQTQDTHAASDQLIVRERLLLQPTHQVAQIIERSAFEHGAADADQTPTSQRSMETKTPNARPTTSLVPHPALSTSPLKGSLLMPETESSPALRTPNVYLLFAHEPYYPGPVTQEINATVVAADSLLHPQVRQPDGIRIHDLLTQGRRPGEIIPLATLTHELSDGTDWPKIGDWEGVTTDLVQLVRTGDCDALSLSLREIARALICTGPHSHVRAYDAAADDFIAYGPTERAAVLAEVGTLLASLVAEQDLWSGDGLLAPIARPA